MLQNSDVRLSGRRIYIHQDSFSHLAKHSQAISEQLYLSLGQVAMIKAVYHNFVQEGTMLGFIGKDEAHLILHEVKSLWSDPMTAVLSQLGYISQDAQNRNYVGKVLEGKECIEASCYDDCYYTYSTNQAAADRMFADNEDIKILKKKVREKTGHADLTLINGSSLVLLDNTIGYGDNTKQAYKKKHKKPALAQESINAIKVETFENLHQQLRDIITTIWSQPSTETHDFIEYAYKISCESVNKGILKYKPQQLHDADENLNETPRFTLKKQVVNCSANSCST